MRLGTGPRLLTQPALRTYDCRLPLEARHVSVSLVCLRDLLAEAGRLGIAFYRLASQIVPVLGSDDVPRFRRQLDDCLLLAETVGAEARSRGMRLTVHPALDVQLGSGDERVAQRGAAVACAWEALLTAMGLGSDARIVVHRGGSGAGANAAFAARAAALPPAVRERLALENDERHCSLEAALWLSARTGIPVVWDYLHWRCAGAAGRGIGDAFKDVARTWPDGATVKLHYSSPRTGAVNGRPPQAWAHAEYIDPFAFHDFAVALGGDCDVMLEAGGKDLALLKLRHDLMALGLEGVLGPAVAPGPAVAAVG